ncbi:cartilage matrix protein isoform X2 [Lingula anatina]|uniref:Cartilage matrix protein isoform X1 n=1 Tax=Lingula anatina TaxID=7574 RepID=A0A1S3JGQ7_LINAN|nr:cartilage matrix protein isoform X1 [Lingula anatina]XP_013409332.1 cartilage matrix protein isoform X2 [Lingula anatina]|eukprot:XP_013409331.1 cartilage matrix protein isoform X1 [Lingula anatina]
MITLSMLLCGILISSGEVRADSPPGRGDLRSGTQTVNKGTSKICGDPLDIIFVIDGSYSIWSPHFVKQKEFLRGFVEEFNIERDGNGTRIGAIVFADNTEVAFNLKDHFNKDDLFEAIDRITQIGGGTHTDKALIKVREEMLLPSNGARLGKVPQIIIVMTDGVSWDPNETKKEAERLHNGQYPARVISIGIGLQVDQNEIYALSSLPKEKNVFTVTSYETLQEIKNDLAIRTCEVKSPEMEWTDCGINRTVDVAFVLGESTTTTPESTAQILGFVRNLTSRFTIGDGKIRVALVPADCNNPGFHLSRFNDRQSIFSHLDNYRMDAPTNAGRLHYLRTVTFTSAKGARDGVRKLAITVLTNKSRNVNATIAAAEEAKEAGIEMIAIGIGDEVDTDELHGIASTTNRVFRLLDYNAFRVRIRRLLYKVICKGETTPHPATTEPPVFPTVCLPVTPPSQQ